MKANRLVIIRRITRAIEKLYAEIETAKVDSYAQAVKDAKGAVRAADKALSRALRALDVIQRRGFTRYVKNREAGGIRQYGHGGPWCYLRTRIEKLRKLQSVFTLALDETVIIPQTHDFRDLLELLV